MDTVEKLSVGVAKMELEHHARGDVIKHLREEREDHLASSLRIRTLLAPLLGVPVDNEPADEMVGRFVALYEARDERVAEQRGHDKAMEWVATLAFDFDPFDESWTDEQRGAGERVLGLFAERLRDEVGGGGETKWGKPVSAFVPVSPLARGTVTGVKTAWESAKEESRAWNPPLVPASAPPEARACTTCGRPIWGSVRQGPGLLLDAEGPHTCFPERAEATRAKLAALSGTLDGGLTNEEVAAVRALLKREDRSDV